MKVSINVAPDVQLEAEVLAIFFDSKDVPHYVVEDDLGTLDVVHGGLVTVINP